MDSGACANTCTPATLGKYAALGHPLSTQHVGGCHPPNRPCVRRHHGPLRQPRVAEYVCLSCARPLPRGYHPPRPGDGPRPPPLVHLVAHCLVRRDVSWCRPSNIKNDVSQGVGLSMPGNYRQHIRFGSLWYLVKGHEAPSARQVGVKPLEDQRQGPGSRATCRCRACRDPRGCALNPDAWKTASTRTIWPEVNVRG